jgi:hypothetical protein
MLEKPKIPPLQTLGEGGMTPGEMPAVDLRALIQRSSINSARDGWRLALQLSATRIPVAPRTAHVLAAGCDPPARRRRETSGRAKGSFV